MALITQHTTFLSDLPVRSSFGRTPGSAPTAPSPEELVERTLDFANQLTGEPIDRCRRA